MSEPLLGKGTRVRVRLSVILSALVFSTSVYAGTSDPVGEYADYVVDRNSSRTSSMILSGTAHAEVTGFSEGTPEAGPSYAIRLDYDFLIQFMGRYQGSTDVDVPAEYFTPEFLETLRETGHYETEQFKIDHVGFADARNLDGGFYPNCDVILIYDIQQKRIEWTNALFGMSPLGEIENMRIKAHVAADVPVLGAVKLDMTGEYEGMPVRAGADYKRP